MAFTEFYCQSGGSNLNAGSTNSNTAAYTSTNGNWSTVTNIFTPTDGSNPSSTVNVGDFASIYIDGASVGVFIVRVTAVQNAVNGTITVSSTVKAGTAPTTSTTTRTIKVGGALKGPNGSSGYPIILSGISALKNTNSDIPRFNLKNDATYSITSGISQTDNGPMVIQGYTTSVGDLGRAIIDGGTSTINLFTLQGSNIIADIIVQNNGTTGTNAGFTTSSGLNLFVRCVANNIRGNGFEFGNSLNTVIECEAYLCNKSNTAGDGGFSFSSSCTAINCISHDNSGSNNDGFTTIAAANSPQWINCIAETNGRHGFSGQQRACALLLQCDAYNNGTDGYRNTNTNGNCLSVVRNCNFIKNGGYGINSDITTGIWDGLVNNCGFGSGTQANGSGSTNATGHLVITGSVNYASGVTPWVDPANGDFRINLAAAKAAGRGAFTETQASYAGTIGYPDIGSAQHLDTGSTQSGFIL